MGESTVNRERIVSVYGREYNLSRWPYGSSRPFYVKDDVEFVEELIEQGLSTARMLYMRGIYTAEEMELHMDKTLEAPLFGVLCPHFILPENCSHCCGEEPEYWMGP